MGDSKATLGILLPPSWPQHGLFLAGRSRAGWDDSEAGGGEGEGPAAEVGDGKGREGYEEGAAGRMLFPSRVMFLHLPGVYSH